ncbi:hypothetical protein EYZ11_013132 [Aspergillus tanneri]|uniref:Carboxylic ester hydrolase n=1 Tax=Aspergillus tanneri TaxID=1220188 RepID=A0A4S3J3V7_9EURO|nr:hypothetical protein EYZ11_013132 [Aspergillus tanneri]
MLPRCGVARVWVFIQGGGYARNSDANYNGTKVIQESGHTIVFVELNYRVGALGFLASERLRKNGDLNVGLLDQRMALCWVQKHIRKFGGNPEHVVIHGDSAGAGSVSYHLAAYGGRDEQLFIGGIVQSPFWPILRTVAESEWQFDRFIQDSGCANSYDALACLRAVDIETLQTANAISHFPGTGGTPLPRWYFLPVIDGDFVVDRLYNLFDEGRFVKVPLMVGDDTDEGSYFAINASTSAEVSQFFRNNYPNLDSRQLETINQAYLTSTVLPKHAAYFPVASAAYGDCTFTCPGSHIASAVAKHFSPDQVWNYRVNIQDQELIGEGLGVPHTFEIPAIFGPGYADTTGLSFETYNAGIVPITMHYWISFIRSLDPNVYRHKTAPQWDAWGANTGMRLKLQTNATVMERVPRSLTRKCQLWHRLAPIMGV